MPQTLRWAGSGIIAFRRLSAGLAQFVDPAFESADEALKVFEKAVQHRPDLERFFVIQHRDGGDRGLDPAADVDQIDLGAVRQLLSRSLDLTLHVADFGDDLVLGHGVLMDRTVAAVPCRWRRDRKSTRLNSSH